MTTANWADYVQFTNKACITRFSPAFSGKPATRKSFNDLLAIDSYEVAELSFADRQRKGIHSLLTDAPSFEAHIHAAMRQVFPLSADTPLPPPLKRAAELVKSTNPEALSQFWDKQLLRLEKLIADSAEAQREWDNGILLSLRPAAGKLKTIALKQLFSQAGIGGADWLGQFALGFPITGKLSQKGVYPIDPRVKPPKAFDSIFETSSLRFKERAAKSGFKNAPQLWEEALEQVRTGWLEEPVELSPEGIPLGSKGDRFNVAFRFGVSQADKLRACDDLRHSLTNEACAVLTPIQLVSWDHIAQLFKSMCGANRSWHLFKADHQAAYKQLPLRPADQPTAIIALRHPASGVWFGFRSRTLMFGSIAAVLHYNSFARAISALANFLLGLPMVSYFDDFAALLPAEIAPKALEVFSSFCSLLGITLKPGKSEVGPSVTFLGLRGSFPSCDNRFRLGISLPPEKATKWADLIASFIKAKSISLQQLESLIGKLSFSQTQLFAKFARTQLRPLYRKLYRKVFNTKLSELEIHILKWWEITIRSLASRWVTSRPRLAPWLVYTDAATNPPKICALLFKGDALTPQLHGEWVSSVDPPWCNLFRSTNLILGLELLALVAFFEIAAPQLRGQCVWVYVDNNNVLAAVTRGDSNRDIVAILVSKLWDTLQRFSICAWFSRVPSKLNPADLPTRGRRVPFATRNRTSFSSLPQLFSFTRNALRALGTSRPNRIQGGDRNRR